MIGVTVRASRRVFATKLMTLAAALGFAKDVRANPIDELTAECRELFAAVTPNQQEFVVALLRCLVKENEGKLNGKGSTMPGRVLPFPARDLNDARCDGRCERCGQPWFADETDTPAH